MTELIDIMLGKCPLNKNNHCNNCNWKMIHEHDGITMNICVIFDIYDELRKLNKNKEG